MSNEAFDHEAIDRYLNGQMAEVEEVEFEGQMGRNAGLAREVRLQQDIRNGIELFEFKSLKKKLKSSDHHTYRHGGPPKPGNKPQLFIWLAAAAFLGLVLLLIFLFFVKQENYQELVAENYQPYPNIISPVNRASEVADDELKEALYAYENGRYRQAAALFEKNESQLEAGYRFYLALSYFETGKTDKTIGLLSEVIEKEDSLFYFPSLWYQALAYLRADQQIQARENLKKLSEGENSYQKEAAKLLEKLE